MLFPSSSLGDNSEKVIVPRNLPTRPFGKTGTNVSMFALGGSFDTEQNQLILRQAFNLGVTYWETAEGYRNGKSEKGFGNYFKKYPGDRQKIFLATKTHLRRPTEMTIALEESLRRLNTDYIDIYLWHRIDSLENNYTREVRNWVKKMKSEEEPSDLYYDIEPATFRIRLNDDGDLVNIDLNKPKPKNRE